MRILIPATLAIFVLGVTCMPTNRESLNRLLPDPLPGWRIEGEDGRYGPKNLYQYIDGGAELYLSYDFRAAATRIYIQPGQPDILLDVFDMGSAKNAFGVFSHARLLIDSTFGQGSQYTSGLLQFWKDRYYISILASPETEESREAVMTLAQQIDMRIQKKGALPAILKALPDSGLILESVRYFYHPAWLNSYFFIAEDNILNITPETDAALAKYQTGDSRTTLLVVTYPSVRKLEEASRKFRTNYLPELGKAMAVCVEDSTWTGCLASGETLAVVFNAPLEETVEGLLYEVSQRSKQER
jgi:hypothetical protein